MSDGHETETSDQNSTPASPPADAALDPRDEEIAELRRGLEAERDRALRALAEADNVRRRAQRDLEERTRFANEKVLQDLIPILDNLDRALEAARAAGDAPGVVEGVALIQRELLKALERAGLERYSALGQRFDPNRHEALARMASPSAEADTIVAETAPGYLLNGRVLRAAQVVVAAPPEPGAGDRT